MAGSPGSGASLEGISLGSSEEAELQREGRERRGREAASPAGVGGSWGGCPGVTAGSLRFWGCQLPGERPDLRRPRSLLLWLVSPEDEDGTPEPPVDPGGAIPSLLLSPPRASGLWPVPSPGGTEKGVCGGWFGHCHWSSEAGKGCHACWVPAPPPTLLPSWMRGT